jgi:uncharacterized protein YbjT (DUF2867 family)
MGIVVIGGTGLVGSKLVALLRHRGEQVRAASPMTGVDTLTRSRLPPRCMQAEPQESTDDIDGRR